MTTLSTAIGCRGGEGEAARSWSDLPEGLLHTILMRLCSLVDLVSFKFVCHSWHAVASSLSPSVIASLFPPLILCPARLHCRSRSSVPTLCPTRPQCRIPSCFGVLDPFSLSFSSLIPFNMDKLDKFNYLDQIFCSQGHLFGVSRNRFVLINLLTGDEFCSPVLPKERRFSNRKHREHFHPESYVLTSPLSSPDSGLLGISPGGPLLYWHIGSASWSWHWPRVAYAYYLKFITVQGKVYAMDPKRYSLFVLDFSPKLHMRSVNVITKDRFFRLDFLVDCGGELLHVGLSTGDQFFQRFGRFEAFQLDLSVNRPRWMKKETLGNWAIFARNHPWFPALAVENPERWGGRSNCVYFIREDRNLDSPFVVFKLGDEIDLSAPESLLFHFPCATEEFRRLSELFHPGI